MKTVLRFPIRLKILITMLIVVTGVVSAIVITMANLFHEDKKTYITDLAAMVAESTAQECRSILESSRERLQVYSRIIADQDLPSETKTDLLRKLFADFPDLVGVSVTGVDEASAAVFNGGLLTSAGLSRDELLDDLKRYPLPLERIRGGEVYVRNSTLSRKLPTLTLAMPDPAGNGVLIAVVRSSKLLRVTSRSETFEVFVTGSDGRYLAHSSLPMILRRREARMPETERDREGGVTAQEYVVEGIDVIGGQAEADFAGVVAVTRIPRSAAYLASRELLSRLVLVALSLLLLSAILGLIGAYRLTGPIQRLSAATRRIARGAFDTKVAVQSRDEIVYLDVSNNQNNNELHERERALDEAHSQLIQSEKMAAFGKLGAGIAHEVKNPLAGILGCAQLSLRKVDPDTPVEKNLRLIEKETKRCKSIIENLLRFARQEKTLLEPIHINAVVLDAVAIVGHQLGMNKVVLEQELADELPMVHGNANQLQQVLMNLLMNAQQAMEGRPGTVRVATSLSEAGQVQIVVADNGPGMPADVQDKLFEPFFTTKPGGKGTGLGLSVSFGIIKDHGGDIRVESRHGEGTEFQISLPRLHEHVPELAPSATIA